MAEATGADGKPIHGPSAVEILDKFFEAVREKRARNGDVSKTLLINAVLSLAVIVNAQQAQINALLAKYPVEQAAPAQLKMLTQEEVAKLDAEARARRESTAP